MTRTCSGHAFLSVTVRKSYLSQPSPSGFSVTHALYSVSEVSGTHFVWSSPIWVTLARLSSPA